MSLLIKKSKTQKSASANAAKAPFFGVQAKLKMGQSGDKYEAEADRVADQVVNKPYASSGLTNTSNSIQQKPLAQSITPAVQLKVQDEEPIQQKTEEEDVQAKNDSIIQRAEEEESIQAKATNKNASEPSPGFAKQLYENRKRGEALPKETQSKMEQNFGTDFSGVTIHNDQQAQEMSTSIGAQAFTNGSDIYFNQDKYKPGSTAGDLLLAHELTHTIQQGAVDANKKPQNDSPANAATKSVSDSSKPEVQDLKSAKSKLPDSKQKDTSTQKKDKKTQENIEADTGSVYPTSPEEDPAFQALTRQSDNAAQRVQTTPAASTAAAQGAAAAPVASNEQTGAAQAGQVDLMNEQEPGTFDAVAFKARLMERIEAMQLPANEEEADDFENNNDIDSVTASGTTMAAQEREQAAGPIAQATSTTPDPGAIPAREPQTIPEPAIGNRPSPLSAQQAMPAPRPDSQVSAPLQENLNEVDSQLETNGVTNEMLANSNEPSFTGALETTEEARQNTAEAPQQFRQGETQALSTSQNSAHQTSESGLTAMHERRGSALTAMQQEQQTTSTSDSGARERIASEIGAIYERTKTAVEHLLTDLDEQVSLKFTAAAKRAKKEFEDYVDQKMEAYKDERYSGLGGAVTWVGDAFTGLPDEVNAFFEEGRARYIEAMDGELTQIAQYIAQKLSEAKNLITQGKQEVANYVAQQPEDLRTIADEAAANIDNQFDTLEQDVNNKQDELIDALAQQYQDSLSEVDARIEEMQAANRGLIDMALGAVMGVIETIISIKNMLTNLLSAALDAIGAIISDPIGFLMNLISGVKQGFLNFGTNIMTHLMTGLVTWLTGALGPMGITIPEDIFSLKGIFSLVMQVLGLTWDYMRQKAVKLLGEPVVQALETGFELFQIIRTEGIAGLWEYLKDQFNDLKETVIEGIQDMIITTVVDAGIKWVLGLMSPAGAFVKAAMMIIDIVKFFIERGSQIMALVTAFIDGIRAVASGNVGFIAEKIEDALGRAIPVIIGFLASLLGISGLARKVQNLIGNIRKRIDKAIDKLILKAKKAFGKLVRKGKKAVGKFVDWLGIKKNFKTKDGKTHKIFLEEKSGKTELMVQSEKQQVGERLAKAKLETAAMTDGDEKTNRIAAQSKIERYLAETRSTTQKITLEERKSTPDSAKIEAWQTDLKNKFNAIAGDLQIIGVEPGTAGTGDNAMMGELGKKYLKKNNTELSVYGKNQEQLVKDSGYHYGSNNGKKTMVRDNATDAFPKLSFDDSGKLQLGSGSSGKPEHDHFAPSPEHEDIKETNKGYEVKFTVARIGDDGKKLSGQNAEFKIDVTYGQALEDSNDLTETRTVEADNLRLKATGLGRGKTDSAQGGFHNAHLVADRFGGTGYNAAKNIHPSSPNYNTKKMKDKEDLIARLLNQSNSFDQNSFELKVSAILRKESAQKDKLIAELKKEANNDNELKDDTIFEAMAKKLSGKIRSDILGVPGQFMQVNYNLQGTSIDATTEGDKIENHELTGSISDDKGYDDLIKKLLKENN